MPEMNKNSSWSRLQSKLHQSFLKLYNFLHLNDELGEEFGDSFAFDRFDEDGSGTLNRVEIVAAFTTLGIPLTSQEVELVVQRMDPDHNDIIDLEEFETAIRKMANMAQADWLRSSNQLMRKSKTSLEAAEAARLEEAANQRRLDDQRKREAYERKMEKMRRAREAEKEKRRKQKEDELARQAHLDKMRRKQLKHSSSSVSLKPFKNLYRIGEMVEALGPADGCSYPGKIVGVSRNKTYDLQLTVRGQAKRFVGVREEMIRAQPNSVIMMQLRQEMMKGAALRTPPSKSTSSTVLWPRSAVIKWQKPRSKIFVDGWKF